MNQAVTRRKPLFTLAFKLGVSAALIWYVVGQTDIAALPARLAHTQISWLILALLIMLLQVAIAALRWFHVLHATRIEYPFVDTLRVVCIGLFFNQTMPSTIGGDIVRIWELRRADVALQPASISILLDRIAGLAAMVLLVAATLPILFTILGNATAQTSLSVAVSGCLAGLVLLVTVDRLPGAPRNWRIVRFVSILARDARRVFLSAPTAYWALGTSLVIAVISGVCLFFIARSLHIDVSLLHCCVLTPPILLITTLPISLAGWGVREAAMVTALAYVDVNATDALILSVLFGLIVMIVGLPGGLMWLKGPPMRQTPSESEINAS